MSFVIWTCLVLSKVSKPQCGLSSLAQHFKKLRSLSVFPANFLKVYYSMKSWSLDDKSYVLFISAFWEPDTESCYTMCIIQCMLNRFFSSGSYLVINSDSYQGHSSDRKAECQRVNSIAVADYAC